MNKKVFRLHAEGSNTLSDWDQCGVYNTTIIDNIQDPDGATAQKEITSIPSPFARIDLVKTAFAEVNKSGTLDGNTIYHKMVSDSLDVGQIFFNFEKLKSKFDIIYWDKTRGINTLKQGTPGHTMMGKTLEMFFLSDAATYNFDMCDGLYLLRYKGQGYRSPLDIVGATSPATLFFSTANDLGYIGQHISFDGRDNPFDTGYAPLYKRDTKFVKYLWALSKSYPNFALKFKEVADYLNKTFEQLSQSQKDELAPITNTSIKDYAPLHISTEQALQVHVVQGLCLHGCPAVKVTSDFEIKSSLLDAAIQNEQEARRPLVLPVKTGNRYEQLQYVTSRWNGDNLAPYFDNTPINERVLPFEGSKHPYLTIGDFLEDEIINVPYKLNDNDFYSANYTNTEQSFLLPLKDLFFEYFTVNDLLKMVFRDGKGMMDISDVGSNGCTVTLRIPIKGAGNIDYVEYSRIYYAAANFDPTKNEGYVIRDKKVSIAIMPMATVPMDKLNGRVVLVDKGLHNAALVCRNGNEKVKVSRVDGSVEYELLNCAERSFNRVEKDEGGGTAGITTYVTNHKYDHIVIDLNNSTYRGVVVPRFVDRGGNKQFTFAVDFGTTNTHIEYAEGANPSKSFDISNNEKQLVYLHNGYGDDHDIPPAFVEYFVPNQIGVAEQDEYHFPLRSVLSESMRVDYGKQCTAMVECNMSFNYSKQCCPLNSEYRTNIKWDVSKNKERMVKYIENLCVLMRNKVLLNNGKLEATRVIWFYPVSMKVSQQGKMHEAWQENYTRYFGGNCQNNVVSICESEAPYGYYSEKEGANGNVVTIDIGGGTSDVYIVSSDQSQRMISSFRFASNAIFGDGYNQNISSNGFVRRYHEKFMGVLAKDNAFRYNALNEIYERGNSSDLCASYFSLKELGVPALDFMKKLSEDKQLKYPVVIFYSAIIYYVALQMKAKGIAMPQNICFSGNGSLTLRVLSHSERDISLYVQRLFEKVYGGAYPNDRSFKVKISSNPKTATCKGGIVLREKPMGIDAVKKAKCFLLGTDVCTIVDKENTKKFDDLSAKERSDVVQQVKKFIDDIFDLGINGQDKFFAEYFDMDTSIAQEVKQQCKNDMDLYLEKGLEILRGEILEEGANGELEETLFFYPLIGSLNHIANIVVE